MTGRRWVLVVLVGVALLLAGAGQVWVDATADDVVLGTTPVEVTGSAAAPTVTAAALLAGAAVLAGLVGSRAVRIAAAGFLLLAAAVGLWATLEVVLDPVSSADTAAAERTAVQGSEAGFVGEASVTLWAWSALVANVVITACALVVLLGLLRPGTGTPEGGGRRTRPVRRGASSASGGRRPRGVTGESAWERLSRGEDPTDPGRTGEAGPDDESRRDAPGG